MLLVYLMLFEDAPQRNEIEDLIEGAMEGHIQLTGSVLQERAEILKVCDEVAKVSLPL